MPVATDRVVASKNDAKFLKFNSLKSNSPMQVIGINIPSIRSDEIFRKQAMTTIRELMLRSGLSEEAERKGTRKFLREGLMASDDYYEGIDIDEPFSFCVTKKMFARYQPDTIIINSAKTCEAV